MWIQSITFVFCFFISALNSYSNTSADAILGQWMSVRGNVKVQVYREGEEYKAKVLWFKDTDDKSRPMNTRTDEHNPNPALRQRKIIGMQVLSKMRYNSKNQRWEDGKIYDAKTGKEWSAVAQLNDAGLLNLKGFWRFEFIGKTMTFKRVG